MRVCLQVGGGFVSLVGTGIDHRRPLVADALIDLGGRYGLARGRSDATALLQIGRALYAWLDGAEGWLAELRPQLRPPFLLEIQAPLQPTGPDWAVLHAPWEVLADQAGFLAEDAQLRYAPARRLGKPAAPPDLEDYRLGVAFMAAAPRGAQPLDFEAEEAAIMVAAGRNLDLLVEESGDPEELGRRLVKLKPTLPVLHLSSHGACSTAQSGPVGCRGAWISSRKGGLSCGRNSASQPSAPSSHAYSARPICSSAVASDRPRARP